METHEQDHPELNGGVDAPQLEWLGWVLEDATLRGEKVVVFSHAPCYPAVTMDGYAVCWNHEAVCALLGRYPAVLLHLSGHDHEGALRAQWVGGSIGAASGDSSIAAPTRPPLYHLCLEAALEGETGGAGCHGVLEVFADKLIVRGTGLVRDRYMQTGGF